MITQYLLPDSAEQAVADLAPDVAVMGEGTTMMPAVHVGALDASRVVGLARAGLSRVERADGRTTLGATTSLATVSALDHVPALASAAGAVGGPALRNMATVGGNLVVGGDVAVALLALGAEVQLSSRTVPVGDFWSSFEPGEEIVLSVSFEDDPDSVFVHGRGAPRTRRPWSWRSRAAAWRWAWPRAVRSPGAEAGDPAAAAAAEIDPPTDAVASAWYRRRMTELFVRRALEARDAV